MSEGLQVSTVQRAQTHHHHGGQAGRAEQPGGVTGEAEPVDRVKFFREFGDLQGDQEDTSVFIMSLQLLTATVR